MSEITDLVSKRDEINKRIEAINYPFEFGDKVIFWGSYKGIFIKSNGVDCSVAYIDEYGSATLTDTTEVKRDN